MQIRCLLLVDPTKRQSKVRAIFHACLPDAVVHRTAVFAHQLKATTAVPPAPPSTVPYTRDDAAADAAQPATPPQSTSASRRDDSPPPGAPQRRVAGVDAVESLRADGAVQVRHGDGHARAGDDKRQAASDSATPGQAGVAGGEEVDPEGGGCRRPYGQEEVPVVALSESLLLWAWHVWVVAGVAIGAHAAPCVPLLLISGLLPAAVAVCRVHALAQLAGGDNVVICPTEAHILRSWRWRPRSTRPAGQLWPSRGGRTAPRLGMRCCMHVGSSCHFLVHSTNSLHGMDRTVASLRTTQHHGASAAMHTCPVV